MPERSQLIGRQDRAALAWRRKDRPGVARPDAVVGVAAQGCQAGSRSRNAPAWVQGEAAQATGEQGEDEEQQWHNWREGERQVRDGSMRQGLLERGQGLDDEPAQRAAAFVVRQLEM